MQKFAAKQNNMKNSHLCTLRCGADPSQSGKGRPEAYGVVSDAADPHRRPTGILDLCRALQA